MTKLYDQIAIPFLVILNVIVSCVVCGSAISNMSIEYIPVFDIVNAPLPLLNEIPPLVTFVTTVAPIKQSVCTDV